MRIRLDLVVFTEKRGFNIWEKNRQRNGKHITNKII